MVMNEDNEQINTGVESEGSPEPQEASVSESPAPVKQESQSEQQSTESDNVPFHQHPRFKELVEQKNRYADSYKQLESKYAELEAKLSQLNKPVTQSQEKAIISRLKSIDPEFGQEFESVYKQASRVTDLEAQLQEFRAEQVRNKALSTVRDLHAEHKVPADLQELYNTQIEMEARRNPKIGLDDLPNVYKSVHERMSKMLDGVKRAEREAYLADKKKDAKVPTSQPKGKPAQTSQTEFSKDPAEARQQLVSRILKQAKASNSL